MRSKNLWRNVLAAPPSGGYVEVIADSRSMPANTGEQYLKLTALAAGGGLLPDGSIPLTANWDAGSFDITAEQFHSDVAAGTPPFTVVSTTKVDNLNADLLDGQEGSYYASVAYVDSAVVGLLDHKGGYNAATNTPDLDTSPSGIKEGDAYVVTTAGTFYTKAVTSGDWMYAKNDDPTTLAEWVVVADEGGGGGAVGKYKNSAYTASAGELVFADSQSPAFAVTLPASPSTDDVVSVLDVGGNAGTNNITVSRNGNTINGLAENFVIDVNWAAVDFVYSGTTWEYAPRGVGDSLPTECLIIALGDETSVITTGTAKTTFRMPYGFVLSSVKASLTTASSSGIPTFDINEDGTTILSTKLTIDASEKTSSTAATAAVISDANLAADAEITFDIDVAGTGATGPKIYLIGTRT